MLYSDEALSLPNIHLAKCESYAVALAESVGMKRQCRICKGTDSLPRDLSFVVSWFMFVRGVLWAEKKLGIENGRLLYEAAVRHLPNYMVASLIRGNDNDAGDSAGAIGALRHWKLPTLTRNSLRSSAPFIVSSNTKSPRHT